MTSLINKRKKQAILSKFRRDNSVNATEVQVSIINNTAQLTGTVDNIVSKLAAERDAMSITGVKHVKNDINVKSP